MKEEQRKLKNKLTVIYWVNILLFVALVLTMVYQIGISGKSLTEQDFVWERFGIIITIGIIPLSLKLFHDRHKRVINEELPIFLKKTEQLFLLRTLAFDIVIILNLIGFYFIGALNFIYMAGIIILAFALCYPTESMLDPIEKEIENKQ